MTGTIKGGQTRDRILKRTREILITRGFYNTSINDIVAVAGVKKGNLYYHFSSKEDLGIAVLQDAKEDFFKFLEVAFSGDNPLDCLRNFLDAILNEQRKKNFVGGCLFGNTALEMSDNNPEFAEIINGIFGRWAGIIEGYLNEAMARGDLLTAFNPDQLSELMIAAIEGGIMMARVSKDGRELTGCIESLKKLLVSNPRAHPVART